MRSLLGFAMVWTGCGLSVPEGRYSCLDDSECPSGWVCASGRCFRSATRFGDDGGSSDAATDAREDATDDATSDATEDAVGDASVDVADVSVDASGPCSTDAECDDGNGCTDDTCESTGCESIPNRNPCEDGNFCNGSDSCADGACGVHAGDPCGAETICEVDRCVGCRFDTDCPGDMIMPWGECMSPTMCGESGSQTRTISSFSCSGGECVSAGRTETQACSRSTTGISCGVRTCGAYGNCEGTSTCDESGTQSRPCTDRLCSRGRCVSVDEAETSTCTRSTTGVSCSDGAYCNGAETCLSGTCRSGTSPCSGACDESTNECITTTCGPGISSRNCDDSTTLLGSSTQSTQSACHNYCEGFGGTECCEYNTSSDQCSAYDGGQYSRSSRSNDSLAACTDDVRSCSLIAGQRCNGAVIEVVEGTILLLDCDRICEYVRGASCCQWNFAIGSFGICSVHVGGVEPGTHNAGTCS